MSIIVYILKAAPYVVDGKADGLHVLPHFLHTASVLLHQAHDEGAAILTIIRVIIRLFQLYDKLRIHPEGIYEEKQGLARSLSTLLQQPRHTHTPVLG